MTHLKRQRAPKNWPIQRKGTAYIMKSGDSQKSIPMLIVIRDILKLVQNRNELKKAIHNRLIELNKKPVRDEKNSVYLFDVITIKPSKKNYRLSLSEKGKFVVEETKESETKVCKVIDKKMLNKGKVQLNLLDGKNYLSDLKCSVNDSVLIDLKQNKPTKCLELKQDAKAFAYSGKHAGKKGVIKNIDEKHKIVQIESENKEKINVLIKDLIVIE